MPKRYLKVALLVAITVLLVLGISSVALADQTWPDLPDTVTAKYGVTDNQVAAISNGFDNGLWKPYQSMTRAQFVKMAVTAFKIPLVSPATPAYTDVPKTNYYYQWVEAANAAGLVNGVSPGVFSPNATITREQAVAIVVRWVAKANGYDLATYYTAAQIDALLAKFGDASKVSADLKDEMAFAVDFGIIVGNDFGKIEPQACLTRIQGAAIIIRATAKCPPIPVKAAKIEILSDKAENMIGQAHVLQVKATKADGSPAAGVLVDFDTIYSSTWYVGNIIDESAITDKDGIAKTELLSTEPGIQRVSAAVNGVAAVYATKYWLALDEVYTVATNNGFDNEQIPVENNAGTTHDWSVRVVVFGPGPRSTNEQDWYDAISKATFDPTNIKEADGIDFNLEVLIDDIIGALKSDEDLQNAMGIELPGGTWQQWADWLLDHITRADHWDYSVELLMDDLGYLPRTLAGIDVKWNIVNVHTADPDDEDDVTIPSVGDIVKVDGAAITAAKSAVGKTNAEGLSTITISSTKTGQTLTTAVADYAGNPYPGQLFSHLTHNGLNFHFLDWEDQPTDAAMQLKTWIPHIIGEDNNGPLVPSAAVNNTGEVETYTLTLKDTLGNAIPGYTVEWWIQGVGFFKMNDTGSTWVGIGEQNKQLDMTDANGVAKVMLKSIDPGQTIIHVKVSDKFGLPYHEWTASKQWYAIEDVTVGQFDEDGEFVHDWEAENVVNNPHDFVAAVSGAKWVFTVYDLNDNGLSDDEALVGNRQDMFDATGFTMALDGTLVPKGEDIDVPAGVPFTPDQGETWYVRPADTQLQDNQFWEDMNDDGIDEIWAGLAGKTVYFFNNVGPFQMVDDTLVESEDDAPVSNTAIPTILGEGTDGMPLYVGSITAPAGNPPSAVTDANGFATVTINSTVKGDQYVYAVADYTANPEDGNPLKPLEWAELLWDYALKTWTPDTTTPNIKVFGVADDTVVQGDRYVNPVLAGVDEAGAPDDTVPSADNVETLAVQVFDQFGNALEGYKVTWQMVGLGSTTEGSIDTYHPFAHFADAAFDGSIGDLNRHKDGNPFIGDVVLDIDDAPWNPANTNADAADQDFATGFTLNGEINNTLTLDSAAHVDLVLDESLADLEAGGFAGEEGITHFSDIVNVKVYTPAGVLMTDFEVTKVWSLEAPEVTSIALVQSDTGTAPFTADPITTVDGTVTYQATLLDQFGNVDVAVPANAKFYLDSTVDANDTIVPVAPVDGVAVDAATLANGTYTVKYWIDTDNDNVIDAGELVSNAVTTIVVIAVAPPA